MFRSNRFFPKKQVDLAATSFIVELIKKVRNNEPIEPLIKKQSQATLNQAMQLIINYLSRLETMLDSLFIKILELYPFSNEAKVIELIVVLVNKQVDLDVVQVEQENPELYKLVREIRTQDLIVDEFIAIGDAIHKERSRARTGLTLISPSPHPE